MSAAERERVLRDLEESRGRLLSAVEAFPEEQFFTPPAEGCWSAAGVLEHVVFVEGRVLARIAAGLPAAEGRRSAMEGKDDELLAQVRKRAGKIEAPDTLHPKGGMSREELVEKFRETREATMRFAAGTQADLRGQLFPHPIFGEVDGYQWLALIAAHCDRHSKQMEECRRAF